MWWIGFGTWLALTGCHAQGVPSGERKLRAEPARPETPSRVVAVGDLHGDLGNTLQVLRLAEVVDHEGNWAAGSATVVQTGDFTDRGPDSRAIMERLRGLQGEASAAGGELIVLLGNHEVMNLLGDWRYVHPGDLAAYGGEGPRKEAFSPAGEDGAWLRRLDAVAKVGDVVFAHGGVTPQAASLGIEGLNDAVRAALEQGPRAQGAAVLGESGPLWYRGYVQDPDAVACPRLEDALSRLDATRMVVGHTTRTNGRIQSRCSGALAVIDIGIGEAYGGHIGAWELEGGDAKAAYRDGPADLPDP